MAKSKITTELILRMSPSELRSLPKATLKSYASQVSRTANKRFDNLKKAGLNTPAYANAQEGGRFSIKGLNTTQSLLMEIWRVREFIDAPTSKVSIARKYVKYASEKNGGELSEEESKTFWRAYRKVEEDEGKEAIKQRYGSDKLQSDMLDEYKIMGLPAGEEAEEDLKLYGSKLFNKAYERGEKNAKKNKRRKEDFFPLK